MSLHLDIGWLLATMLLSVRIAAATMLAPVLGPAQMPATVRIILSLALAGAVAPALPTHAVESLTSASPLSLVAAALAEALIGSCFSLGFLAAYAATQLAGRALDMQLGFSVAAVLNPATQTPSPLIGTVYGLAAVALFLSLDGHHVLIRALALSAQQSPPGAGQVPDWSAVIGQSGLMFTFAAALAAPVMLVLLLTDLAMAMMARSMPALNAFVLSFVVKAGVGLVALAGSLQLTGPLLGTLYSRTFQYWEHLAGTAP